MRIGFGYDIHAFGPGTHVTLAGIEIPHTHGVVAHSDGDVMLHALCDALLGAMGLGDIGQHFPDSDAPDIGPLLQVIPTELAALHEIELVLERKRIVIVDQFQRLARL